MASNLVDVHTLGQFFDRDIRTIQLWVNEGMPRENRGKYDFVKCVRWRIGKLEEENEALKTTGDEEYHSLRKRGQDIKNKRDEIALKRDLSKLLDKKSILIVTSNLMAVVKNQFEYLENNLIRDLDGVKDEKKKRATIKDSVKVAMESVSNMNVEQFINDEDKLFEIDEE